MTGAVALAVLVGTVITIVLVTSDQVVAREVFDVSGDARDIKLDPPDPMERPTPSDGVELPAPRRKDRSRDDRPPAKPTESCGPGRSALPKRGGFGNDLSDVVALGSPGEVCVAGEARQAKGLTDAPLFETADGFDPAPEPEPAPEDEPDADPEQVPEDEPADPGPSDAPTDQPSEPPTDDPTEEPTPNPSDPSDEPDESAPSAGADEAARTSQSSPQAEAVVAPLPAASGVIAEVPTALPPAAGEYLAPGWVEMTPATSPPATYDAAMVNDPVRNQVVRFGGHTSLNVASNATWIWNGTTWAQAAPSTSPPARWRASMAWDPITQRVILFGGQSNSTTPLNDVWAWDGTTWTQLTPTGTPPVARTGAAMAFDPVRGGMVMFGGADTAGARNDTWQLKNDEWSEIEGNGASGAPEARHDMTLAYSTSTSQLLLFGGGTGPCPSASCVTYSDTWILGDSASSWSQQSPTHAPPARGSAAITYDPGLGGVVLFGGIDWDGSTKIMRNDTWAWTGTDWGQAVGIASPEGRSGHAMAAMNDGQVVMFGGVDGTNVLTDTWTYDTSLPVLEIELLKPTAASGDQESAVDPIMWVGDQVRVKITAHNSGSEPITATALTSALQETLLAAGTLFNDGNIELCSVDDSDVCGSVMDLTASITNLSIPVGESRVGDFIASIAGTQRGCEIIDVPAVASNITGTSAEVFAQLTVCGGGLGIEDWWTYDTTDLGGGGAASVNVANGNLVVKQYDTNPVQTPGRLAIGLGRVYNSQDHMSAGGPLGVGWQFDIGDTGEFAGGFGIAGLSLPNLQTVLQPLSMPYIDRDGTRHVFKLRSITTTVGDLSLPIDLTGQQGVADSILGLLNPATLPFDLTSAVEGLVYGNLCIDQAYTGPPGSDMFLFRYIGMGDNDCVTPAQSGRLTIGWSLVRADRLRYDFNASGDLVAVTDPTGQQLIYTPGVQYGPTEIYTAACGKQGTCPKVTIDYNAPGAPSGHRHVKVTDTAGRVTSYIVTNDPLLPQLTQVWEAGNPLSGAAHATPSAAYTYSTSGTPCPGSAAEALTVGQLCSVTDALGHTTTFTYTPAPLGPDRILKVTDRRGTQNALNSDGNEKGLATVYTWEDPEGDDPATLSGPPTYVTADMGSPNQVASCGTTCERVRYSSIDDWGRVGQVAEGSSMTDPGSGTFLRQTGYFWDGLGAQGGIESCQQPAGMDHHLCQTIRRAVPSTAPFVPGTVATSTVDTVTVHDEAVDYTYSDLGQLLRQRVLLDASQPWTDANSAITTWGTHDQYFDANGDVRAFNNHVTGNGQIATNAEGTSYPSTVKRDGPANYWRLGETSGTVMIDEYGQNGTHGANVALGKPGAIGGNTAANEAVGGSVINSLSGFAHGTSAADSDFTVETWQKTTDTGSQQHSLSWGASGQFGLVGRNFGGRPMIYLASNTSTGAVAAVQTTASWADGNWHHVVYTYDGSGTVAGMAIWVDGVSQVLTTIDNDLAGAYATTPAFARTLHSGAPSTLDEVSAYTKVLTPDQIIAHYQAATSGARVEPDTLYAVTDQIQELSPRGNDPANSGTWGDYLTVTRRDVPADGSLTSTNAVADPGGEVCGAADRGNTGLVCEVDTPASAGIQPGVCQSPTTGLPNRSTLPPTSAGYRYTCTTYAYNSAGQRTLMRTPNANAASSIGNLEPATTYKYYANTTSCSGAAQADCDLSGTVSAGGWLKAVIDPTGEKTVFAYDAAGNIARTWERNATSPHALAADWTNATTPPTRAYTEQVNATPVTSDSLSVSNTALIAIGPDGTTWGHGANAAGELGDGTTTTRSTPTQSLGLTNIVQVAQSSTGALSGCSFTWFLAGDGRVWVTGSAKGSPTPQLVGGLSDIIQIAVGGCHALALDAQGRVFGWGINNNGQVGNGTTANVNDAAVQVLDGVSTIAAGYLHSLAVKTDGSLWTWGRNVEGQLGHGDSTQRTAPTKVTTLTGVRSISGGALASYALTRDGKVWSWGANNNGDLGLGDTTPRATPTRITTLGAGTAAGPVRQLVGAAFGAAALMADGKVRAWGLNNAGQLAGGASGTSTSPVLIPNLNNQIAIAGGWATYATADAAGTIKVWGSTSNHQLGTGANPSSTTTPTAAGQNISPFRLPGWSLLGTRNAVGDLTTQTTDRLGQVRRIRSGRGHEVYTAAFDRALGYDQAGRPSWGVGAQHRSTTTVARITYDPYGNPIKTVDATGIASRATFDAVNRQLTSQATRGTSTQAGTTAAATCTATATTAEWTAAQNGHLVCVTSTIYDGLDHPISVTDANSQVTRSRYDAAGRQIRIRTPRNDGTYTTLSTWWVYDRDGNVLHACPPRQFDAAHESDTTTNDQAGCDSASGKHSVHTVYDRAGRPVTSTRFRTAYNGGNGTAATLETSFTYDADGNTVAVTDPNGNTTSSTFDYQGRQLTRTVPRAAGRSLTTTWRYDPSGNVTAITLPGARDTGAGTDGDLTIDGATNGASNPYVIPDDAEYRNLTLTNGAHATAANAHGLEFTVSGDLTVCATCVITMNGKGRSGGAAGINGNGNGGNGMDASNPNPGNGGTGGQTGLLSLQASGGGGGGHKTDGQPGTPPGANPGDPGLASGTADLTDVGDDYLAGAGGGGGGGGAGLLGAGGAGGNGGGYIHITAETITVNGLITAAGQSGAASAAGSGGGGGGAGAGGAIWLSADTITLATNSINVAGGTGGIGAGSGSNQKNGGNGAAGRVRLDSNQDTIANTPAGADLTRTGRVTAISYDAANRPVDTLEGALTSQADPTINNGPTAAPDPDGYANTRTRAFYNADGQVAAVLPPTAFSNADSLLNPATNRARRVDYDLDGNQIAAYAPRYDNTITSIGGGNDGGTGANQQTSQCTTGRVTDTVAGLADYSSSVGVCVTRATFDPLGRILRQYLPTSSGSDNGYLEYTYTGDQLVRRITGPDPNSTGRLTMATSYYDGTGRPTKVEDTFGNGPATSYTGDGLVAQTTGQPYVDNNGPSVTELTTFAYDAGGNTTTTFNPEGDSTTSTWTTDGLLANIVMPRGATNTATTQYTYDNLGNQTRVYSPRAVNSGSAPSVNEFTRDNLLAATHTPVSTGVYRTTRYVYSPAGLKTATRTGKCTSTDTTNCTPGNSAWTDAGTQRVTYAANGRVKAQQGVNAGPGRAIRTTYTQDGRPATISDNVSNVTTTIGYYLDSLTRTVNESGSGLATGQAVENTYAYDAAGQPTVRTDQTGAAGVTGGTKKTTSYAYNHAGLPTAMNSDVLGTATTFAFDDAGRLTTATTGAHVNEWSWHPNNALAGAKNSHSTTTMSEYDYDYDNNRNIIKQTATGTIHPATTTATYAPGQQIKTWSYTPTGSNPKDSVDMVWEYDRNSNRTSQSVSLDGATATETTWTYRLDNSVGTQDGPDAGTADQHTYTYNNRGLLTNTGCTTTSYDTFDRTTQVTQISGQQNGCGDDSYTTTYTYDALDRQRSSQVTGSNETGANTTTRSIYDGLSTRLIGQTNAVNGAHNDPTVHYQLDPSGEAVAYKQTGGETPSTAHLDTDGHGNITTITTDSGNFVCGVAYDPYGVPVGVGNGDNSNGMCQTSSPRGNETGNSLWYRGQTRNGTTGTYQLGTRTYNPSTGAFTTPDSYRVSAPSTDLSVGVDPLTANTYSYVNGNPLNAWDPTGHMPVRDEYGTIGDGTPVTQAEMDEYYAQLAVTSAQLEQMQIDQQIADAEAAADVDISGMVVDLLGEVSGVNDAIECFENPGLSMACIGTAMTLFGFSFKMAGKVDDLIRSGDNILDAMNAADNARDALTGLRASADEVADRLADAQDNLSDLQRSTRNKTPDSMGTKKADDATGSRAGDTCGLRSFSGDTLVLMADGSYKPIEDIRIGDWVLATDPVTGEQVAKQVTHLWIHYDTLTDLVLGTDDDGDGQPDRVTTTEDHPYWNATDQAWQDIQDFNPGDDLVTDQWRRIDVVGLDPGSAHTGLAYNLTVADLHTYHVAEQGILVHNCGTSDAARDYADAQPRPPKPGDPRTVAVLDTPSGGRYPGASGTGRAPHPDVQQALDEVPLSNRSDFHGQCAEIQCLSDALHAGDSVAGGQMAAARVRGPNSPAHGSPIPACSSCSAVAESLGVTVITR